MNNQTIELLKKTVLEETAKCLFEPQYITANNDTLNNLLLVASILAKLEKP